MEKIRIRLNNIVRIKQFLNISRSFKSDIDVITDRACMDGKSELGLYSLDLSQRIFTRIISDDKEEVERFTKAMEEFK